MPTSLKCDESQSRRSDQKAESIIADNEDQRGTYEKPDGRSLDQNFGGSWRPSSPIWFQGDKIHHNEQG